MSARAQLTPRYGHVAFSEAIGLLPSSERSALLLRDVEQLPLSSVAKRLGCSKELRARGSASKSCERSRCCKFRIVSTGDPLLRSERVPEPKARPSQEPGPEGFEVREWGALVRRIREGDSAAIEELYEAFKALVQTRVRYDIACAPAH